MFIHSKDPTMKKLVKKLAKILNVTEPKGTYICTSDAIRDVLIEYNKKEANEVIQLSKQEFMKKLFKEFPLSKTAHAIFLAEVIKEVNNF